jgi:hypothetical protein
MSLDSCLPAQKGNLRLLELEKSLVLRSEKSLKDELIKPIFYFLHSIPNRQTIK